MKEDEEEFKEGDYIVTLRIDNGEKINSNNYNCARKNYCFMQRIDSISLYPCVDMKGSKCNGHDVMRFNKRSFLKDWRYATPQEIAEYNRVGKPYDTTTLKPKFEVGKWYKHFALPGTYAKFDSINNGYWEGPEWINKDGCYIDDSFSSIEYDKAYEVSLSEIQQYLPDDHPDRIKELAVDDLVAGKFYRINHERDDTFALVKFQSKNKNCNHQVIGHTCTNMNGEFEFKTNYNPSYAGRSINNASLIEKKWLKTCINQDRFIKEDQLDKYDDEGELIGKFEFNRWYKSSIHDNVLLFIKSENTGYGFPPKNEWFVRESHMGNWNLDNLILASDEEAKELLLKYAKEKYPIGTKYRCVVTNDVCETRWDYYDCDLQGITDSEIGVICSNYTKADHVFEWAEIVSKPEDKPLKVGDWVTQRTSQYYNFVPDTTQITEINNNEIWVKHKSGTGWSTLESHYKAYRPATQEEIDSVTKSSTITKESLKRTKIWIGDNEELSRKVQEKLFELGFGWTLGDKTIKHAKATSLYANSTLELAYADCRSKQDYFEGDKNKEIFPSDLGIETNVSGSDNDIDSNTISEYIPEPIESSLADISKYFPKTIEEEI